MTAHWGLDLSLERARTRRRSQTAKPSIVDTTTRRSQIGVLNCPFQQLPTRSVSLSTPRTRYQISNRISLPNKYIPGEYNSYAPARPISKVLRPSRPILPFLRPSTCARHDRTRDGSLRNMDGAIVFHLTSSHFSKEWHAQQNHQLQRPSKRRSIACRIVDALRDPASLSRSSDIGSYGHKPHSNSQDIRREYH